MSCRGVPLRHVLAWRSAFAPAPGHFVSTPRANAGSAARGELLHRPAVAVWILEEHERSPGKMLHFTDLHATRGQLRMRGGDIGNHHLHAPHRARERFGDAFPDSD